MAEEFDKLADLRKRLGLKTGAQWEREREETPETPAGPPSAPAPRPVQRADAFTQQKELLRRIGERLQGMQGADWVLQREELERRRAAGDFEVHKVTLGRVEGSDDRSFILLREDFPLEHRQGNVELGDALNAASRHIALSAADPELGDFDPRKALFMDTETTGLAGGTGTVAFLVGMGYFMEDFFRLDQCFMRDYDDEEAVLAFVGERMREAEVIVSYNGKSFDLPLLRTRFVQNRLPFSGETLLHYDLVHASRRFWKRRLADCSLANIEREILGIERHGDVPGHLIPQMWFDYLNTRDARPLEGVFYHHKMDILSLVSLTAWLSQCLDEAGPGFAHTEDRLSLVRLHFNQKHYEDVIRHANVFLDNEVHSPLRQECLGMLAMAHKRLQYFFEMQHTWERLLGEYPDNLTACLELAKHHEHRSRNMLKAERLLKAAYDISREDPAVLARLSRVRKKLSRGRFRSEEDLPGDDE